jgi:signal transduction histidine kinase
MSEVPDPLSKFDDVTRTALFVVIQECLTNIHKHARAFAITIRISFSAEEFRMEVADDGLGFHSGAREGVDMPSMRERLREVGGVLYVKSGQNRGSSVTTVIPLGPVKVASSTS